MATATKTKPKPKARKHSEGTPAQRCPECGGAGTLHILKADIANVPPEVAKLIESGAYKKVSAEIYDEPPDGIPSTGKMLRRVAFLGGSLPEIKSLADIPTPADGTLKGVEIFAAGTRKDKAYTPQDLDSVVANFERFSAAGSGITKETVVKVPMVAAAVAAVPGHEEEAEQTLLERTDLPAMGWPSKVWRDQKPCPMCGGKGAASYAEFASAFRRVVLKLTDVRPARQTKGLYHCFSEVTPIMTRDEILQALQGVGFDVSGITDQVPDPVLAEILRVLQSKQAAPEGGMMADTGTGTATGAAPIAPAVTPPVAPPLPGIPAPVIPPHPQQVTMKYSEEQLQAIIKGTVEKVVSAAVANLQKPLADKVSELGKFAEDRIAAEKRASITARLEALVKQGKVLPAEIEAGLAETLFCHDARTVQKFSEAGKTVERTPLDKAFAVLEARPMLARFAERIKSQPKPGTAGGNPDDELEKVQRFSEDPNFVHALRAKGDTPEGYVAKFSEAKKKMPALTAAQYGVPSLNGHAA